MSVLDWKSCEFYELVLLSKFCKVDIQSQVVAQCANGNLYVLCEALGVIHFCYKNSWTISFPYRCAEIRFCALTAENEFLVLVAQGDQANSINVNVLNIAGIFKREGAPCVGSALLNAQGCVTAVQTSMTKGSLICISIGLDTGELLLHLSVLNSDMTPRFFRISTGKSIVGIEFQHKMDFLYMFVCSEENILLYHIMDSNIVNTETILDFSTTSFSCCTSQHNAENEYFLVSREDAVYCFTIDGRGPCYAISGKKKNIAYLKNHIVLLIESQEKQQSYVVIMDVCKKRIVLQKEIKHSTNNMLVTNATTCYLLIDNNIFITIERSLQCKLQLLMTSHHYKLALSLIDNKRRKLKGSVLLKYGNYLLNKGDVCSAVLQYQETIGIMNSYLIIKNLVDSKYNSQLLQFMKHLKTTDSFCDAQKMLIKNCTKRINLSSKCNKDGDEICYGNISSNAFLTLINNFDDIYHSNPLCEGKFYKQLKCNSPKTILTHWSKVFKAVKVINNPESCVSVMLTSNEICTEYLEYVVSMAKKDPIVLSVLLELYLCEWRNGKKSESEIIVFLENNNIGYSEKIIILFVNYSFWPGVLYMHGKFNTFQLCLNYCIKFCDSDVTKCLEQIPHFSSKIYMKTFENISGSSIIPIEFVDKVIETVLKERNQEILQIIQGIAGRREFKVYHIKKLFSNNEQWGDIKHSNPILSLNSTLQSLKACLIKFKKCPIEFRENICIICKRTLTLPAAYFLCQHAFHGECVENGIRDNICPLCPTPGK